MLDVHSGDNRRKDIKDDVTWFGKCLDDNLIDRLVRPIDEVEGKQMNNDKEEEVETRIGHQGGAPRASPAGLLDDIPHGSRPQILDIQDQRKRDVQDGKQEEAEFDDVYDGTQGMEPCRISDEWIRAPVKRQVADEMDPEKKTEHEARERHDDLLADR